MEIISPFALTVCKVGSWSTCSSWDVERPISTAGGCGLFSCKEACAFRFFVTNSEVSSKPILQIPSVRDFAHWSFWEDLRRGLQRLWASFASSQAQQVRWLQSCSNRMSCKFFITISLLYCQKLCSKSFCFELGMCLKPHNARNESCNDSGKNASLICRTCWKPPERSVARATRITSTVLPNTDH